MIFKINIALLVAVLILPQSLFAGEAIGKNFQGTWAESYGKCKGNTKLVITKNSIELIDSGSVTEVVDYFSVNSCYGGASSDGSVVCLFINSGELDQIDIDTINGSATLEKSRKEGEDIEFSLENMKLVNCKDEV